MKKLTKLTAILLVSVLLLLSLAGCDKSKGMIEAFTEAGYDVSVVSAKNDKAQAFFTLMGYTAEEIDEIDDEQLIVCYKNYLPAAMIVCYATSWDLKDELIEEEDGRVIDDSAYVEAKAKGKINGNCHFLYGSDAAQVIFAGQ